MSNRRRKRIEILRFPNIKGLPEDVVHTLHHSLVHIACMRRSIERTDNVVNRSMLAAFESCELLKRLRYNGL
jgi:hypothetical protein